MWIQYKISAVDVEFNWAFAIETGIINIAVHVYQILMCICVCVQDQPDTAPAHTGTGSLSEDRDEGIFSYLLHTILD